MPVGPGDDAAVLALTATQAAGVVVSTDTLVEDRDFRRSTSTAADVGVKTAAQNLADVAAMGARPLALLVSLALPGTAKVAWAGELATGLAAECARAGAVMAGGDVSEAAEIVITGTALGTMDGRAPVLRSGARAGDVVALAGTTGRSAAGLALLESRLLESHLLESRLPDPDLPEPDGVTAGLVAAHRRPQPPYPAGPAAAAAGATAMIDTSDGLLRDAARVARASGVVLDLDPGTLPVSDELRAAAVALGRDPASALDWVLSGGEDHALLACFPAGVEPPAPFRVVGRVLPAHGDGAHVLVDGAPWRGGTGWTHFS
jgi:thiamine-monophosphate kinase